MEEKKFLITMKWYTYKKWTKRVLIDKNEWKEEYSKWDWDEAENVPEEFKR